MKTQLNQNKVGSAKTADSSFKLYIERDMGNIGLCNCTEGTEEMNWLITGLFDLCFNFLQLFFTLSI